MCGIAGIIGHLGDANRAALARMTRAMVHRGPDAEGRWESACDGRGWGVMLAHRRLSILDLTQSAAQPMVDPVAGHALAFNGEIYNYVALRASLLSAGHRIASSGDTEVLLRALCVDGPGAIRRLRGMFALGFWDVTARTLLLARDPLGLKPLYLAHNPNPSGEWSLAFASELRALLASALLGRPRLDPQATASVVWNGFVAGPSTAVIGIESLPPGELRLFDSSGRELLAEEHWTMPDGGAAPADEREVALALEESVRRHLASDVPLAVFLSGGVDSASIANLAQRASGESVHTFTLAFEEDEFDESPFARRIAAAIGTQHHEIVLTGRHFVERLDAALESLDQPTFDGLNSFYLSHCVRQAGFTVALAGTGGDELFGGYTSFRDLPVLMRSAQATGWIPERLRTAAARAVAWAMAPSSGALPPQTRWAKLPEMVRRGPDLLALYQLAYALFLPEFQRALLARGAVDGLIDGLPRPTRRRLERETRSRTPLSTISVMETRLFLGERLLRDTDAASMAASIEVRLPLVDRVLLETVDRLPDAIRYQPLGRKSLLRRIGLSGLDPALFDRPKSGFVLPFERWIAAGLGETMDQTMRDPAAVEAAGLDPTVVRSLWQAFLDKAPGLYWSRVWAIFVLVRWCQHHGVTR